MSEGDRSLVAQAASSHRQGLARRVEQRRNLERVHDTRQILAMAERLPEWEIRKLGMATDVRERGLKAARDGNLSAAEGLLVEARSAVESGTLSSEAFNFADTFQQAAESYVQYLRGDHPAALASMTRSLTLCEVLANDHGYPLEMRRVHLARNIARIHASAGVEDEALRITAKLMNYLAGDGGAWPLVWARPPRRDALEDDAALFMLDQVLAESLRLLLPGHPTVLQHVQSVRDAQERFSVGSMAMQQAARSLCACLALLRGDEAGFLAEVSVFFEGGTQSFGLSWVEMEKRFQQIADQWTPVDP